jgi:hypothetical protein
LTVTAGSGLNGDLYRAVFSNSAGTVITTPASLTVDFLLVTTQPASATINAGQTATFTAATNANPAATAQWEISSDSGSSWSNLTDGGAYGGTSTTVLTVTAGSGLNGDLYRAVFSNSAGTVTTTPASLTLTATNPVSSPVQGGPYMISYGVNPQNATPTFIRDHLATMEATLPFDGVGITGTSGWSIMDPGTSISYGTFMSELAPIRGLTFTRLKHNLLAVYVNRPADFFNDWSATIQNFSNLAAALRDSGVEGILFDNEPYKIDPWNYPSYPSLDAQYNIPNSCDYASTKTLAQYCAQASLRGQQIMQAMVAQFPQIQVMFLHGPYESFSGTPSSILPNNAAWANALEGPFTVGFAEGSGPSSAVQDGGELNFTTLSQYQAAYQYRKFTFASDATNVPFIPTSFRPLWSQTMGVDFEVYNRSGPNNSPLSAAALQSTMTNALQTTDRYVWFYSEGIDELDPTSPNWMGQAYLDALTAARAAVPYK